MAPFNILVLRSPELDEDELEELLEDVLDELEDELPEELDDEVDGVGFEGSLAEFLGSLPPPSHAFINTVIASKHDLKNMLGKVRFIKDVMFISSISEFLCAMAMLSQLGVAGIYCGRKNSIFENNTK